MHDFLKPRKGKLGLVDYEKVFTPVDDVDKDIFDLRGIDRGAGALVVVRPDQHVSLVLPVTTSWPSFRAVHEGRSLVPADGRV